MPEEKEPEEIMEEKKDEDNASWQTLNEKVNNLADQVKALTESLKPQETTTPDDLLEIPIPPPPVEPEPQPEPLPEKKNPLKKFWDFL